MEQPEPRRLGDWILGERLGEGQMGAVYRCSRDGDARSYAVKVLAHADPVSLARFEREQAALAALEHPNIARFHQSGRSADGPWLVMDAARGRTLLTWRDRPPLPVRTVLGIARQLADALAHAHARGVHHRDVKPNNALVDASGHVTLVDFGVALIADRPRLTGGDRRPGTPAYAPPEWFDGADRAAEADCYALGVVVHELLVGAPAFPRAGLAALARAKADLVCLDPGLTLADPDSARATELVAGWTARDPDRRWTASFAAAKLADCPAVPPPDSGTVAGSEPSTLGDRRDAQRIGRYLVRGVLGRGGVGIVYRAFDPLLARDVAVKRLHSADAASMVRFQREAQTVAALDHVGIVRILDFGADDQGPFYAMDLVDGPNLGAALAEGKPPESAAIGWAIAVGRALAAAHAQGVVHRDVKPSNILLERGTEPRLVDFGLATVRGAERLTMTEQRLGTPAYMAPEQALGGAVDARTDVHGLGAVLYEMLSGRPPFGLDEPMVVLRRLTTEDPPALPGPAGRVVAQALARDPADRYASMNAFLADLERLRDGRAVTARAVAGPVWRFLRASARPALAVALVAAILGGGNALWSWRSASEREARAAQRLAALEQRWDEMAPAEADSAFQAFADLPDHAGTAALSRGWLAWSAVLDGRGDGEAATDARVLAWSTAADADGERAALEALGEQFADHDQWEALGSVVRALDRRGLGGAAHLREVLRVANRDAEGVDAGAFPLAARLAGATKVPWSASGVYAVDFVGDARKELIVSHEDDELRWIPGGAWLGGEPRPLFARGLRNTLVGRPKVGEVPRWGPMVVGRGAHGRISVVRLQPEPREVAQFDASLVIDVLGADLDGDGNGELYVSTGMYERDLLSVTTSDGVSWKVADANLSTSAANSEITGLAVADVDGDGQPNLYVSLGAFGGYDVRVLASESWRRASSPSQLPPEAWRRASSPPQLTLVTRRMLGEVDDVGLLERPGYPPRLLATVRRDEGWPSDSPLAKLESGMYLLDEDLAILESVPMQGFGCCFADFDGDRATDYAAMSEETMVLLRQAADGTLATERIGGMGPIGTGDADDDGDAELFVQVGDDVWALGTGTDAVPPAPDLPPLLAPPDDADADMAAAWARAEDLVAMGLVAPAIEQLVAIGSLDDGAVGAQALVRAATLEVSRGDDRRAAELYGRAARSGVEAEASAGAADAWASVHEYAKAAEWTERYLRVAPGDTAREAELQRLRAWVAAPSVALDPRALDDRWRVLRPLELRQSREGLVVSPVQPGVLARIPVTLEGDRQGLEVELTVLRTEVGAGITVSLVRDGVSWGGVGFKGGGGGGRTHLFPLLVVGGRERFRPGWPAAEGVGETLTLKTDFVPGSAFASFTRPGGEPTVAVTDDTIPEDGSWELVIEAVGYVGDQPAVSAASIRSLRVTGLRLADPIAATAADQLVRGRFAEVAADGDALLRSVALEALDRPDDALAALRGASLTDAELATLIRTRSPSYLALLRRVLGEGWGHAMHRAWVAALHHNPDDAEANAAVTTLGDVVPTGPNGDAEVTDLLRFEARAWRKLGRADLASEAAQRAVASAARIRSPSVDTPVSPRVGALRELAASLVDADPDAAMDRLEQAIAASPSPEAFADSLLADPTFAPLRADPRWARVEAARKSAWSAE